MASGAIDAFDEIGALENLTTIISDLASDAVAAVPLIINSSKVASKVVSHAGGPAHNAHNSALFAGGKVLGHAAPFFPKKQDGTESMKIGSKNVNCAATLCNDLGDNSMFGPQSDLLKTLRESLPYDKRRNIEFSANFDGRFLDWHTGLKAMTVEPTVMTKMGCLLSAKANEKSQKKSKKTKYNTEKEVWGARLLNEAFQVGIYVEEIGVGRMKQLEQFYHTLPTSQAEYTDKMMNVVAYYTVIKEEAQKYMNEIDSDRYESAASTHARHFQLQISVAQRNTCQHVHTSQTHLKFYKTCNKPKISDPNQSFQLCKDCVQPEVLEVPYAFWRGPKFSQDILDILPSWHTCVIRQKCENEKVHLLVDIHNFEDYVMSKDENHRERIRDLFWYMMLLYGEWSIEKFVTQNLEYFAHPHFLCAGILGPLGLRISKGFVENVDKTLECAMKFINSVNKDEDSFKDLTAFKSAICDDVYKGPLRILVEENLLTDLQNFSMGENCDSISKFPELIMYIQKSLCFESDIKIENQNKYIKSLPTQLLCRKGTELTICTRLRMMYKNQMVLPSMIKSQRFTQNVLYDTQISETMKTNLKRIFIDSQHTIQSEGNPHSRLIAPITREEVNKVIEERGHNVRKTEEMRIAEREIFDIDCIKQMQDFKPIPSVPQEATAFYLQPRYIGKAKKSHKRKIEGDSATNSKRLCLNGISSNSSNDSVQETKISKKIRNHVKN